MKKQTQAIHTAFQRRDAYDALSMPIYHTAAYEFDNATVMADAFCGRSDAPDYSRVTNPTVTYFENKVKSLTHAHEVIAFSSGMAAISNALIALTSTGKNIVTSRHCFGNTYALFTRTLARFGVEARFIDLTSPEEVRNAIDDQTAAIYTEIITNPQMEVVDLRQLATLAHERSVPLLADTTLIPFTQFDAHALGVDIELVSSTKYLSGGATSIGGLIIDYGTQEGFSRCIRSELLLNLGAYMTPHVAYMQTIGLETLAVRYEAQANHTLQLAERLTTLPQIRSVNYPGLPSHPFHTLSKRQFADSYGAMLTIDLADEAACFRFINRLQLIRRATNLFDNRSLAIHPASTIFGPFTAEERQKMDIFDTTIRISVGLEDVDDLFEDIQQALH